MHFYLDHPYKVQPPPSNSDHQEGISLGRGSQFTTRERVGSTRTSLIFAVLMQRKGCVAILRKKHVTVCYYEGKHPRVWPQHTSVQVSELVLNDPITIRPNFHDIHRRGLEKSNVLFSSRLPYIQTRNQQVTSSYIIFLAWWGFAWATHNPYKAYPVPTRKPFSPLKWCDDVDDVSRKKTVKNVNKLFFQQLHPKRSMGLVCLPTFCHKNHLYKCR